MAELKKEDTMVVKFLHHSGVYQRGDIAAFRRDKAEMLIKRGYAEEFKPNSSSRRKRISKEMTPSDREGGYVTK